MNSELLRILGYTIILLLQNTSIVSGVSRVLNITNVAAFREYWITRRVDDETEVIPEGIVSTSELDPPSLRDRVGDLEGENFWYFNSGVIYSRTLPYKVDFRGATFAEFTMKHFVISTNITVNGERSPISDSTTHVTNVYTGLFTDDNVNFNNFNVYINATAQDADTFLLLKELSIRCDAPGFPSYGPTNPTEIADSTTIAMTDSTPTSDFTDSAPTTDIGVSTPTSDFTDSAPTTDIGISTPTSDFTDSAPTTDIGVSTTDFTDSIPTTAFTDSAPTTDFTDYTPTTDFTDYTPTTDFTDYTPTTDFTDYTPTTDFTDYTPTTDFTDYTPTTDFTDYTPTTDFTYSTPTTHTTDSAPTTDYTNFPTTDFTNSTPSFSTYLPTVRPTEGVTEPSTLFPTDATSSVISTIDSTVIPTTTPDPYITSTTPAETTTNSDSKYFIGNLELYELILAIVVPFLVLFVLFAICMKYFICKTRTTISPAMDYNTYFSSPVYGIQKASNYTTPYGRFYGNRPNSPAVGSEFTPQNNPQFKNVRFSSGRGPSNGYTVRPPTEM